MHEVKKISRGYQITLPKAFREKFHLNIGDLIEIVEEKGLFTLQPLRPSQNAAQNVISFLNQLGDSLPDIDEKELLNTLYQERSRLRKSHESHH